METKKRLKRSEVPTEMTWNLSDLFETRILWQQELALIDKAISKIGAFKGSLCKTSKSLLDCLLLYEKASIKMVQLGTYARLKQHSDATNPNNQEDLLAFSAVEARFKLATSFIESEIMALDKQSFNQLLEQDNRLQVFKLYLSKIYDKKEHQLSAETEEALAALSELMNSPVTLYRISKAADMKFEPFKDDKGNLYHNPLFSLNSANSIVRKKAFASFYKTLERYKNTYATNYATEVRKQVALSKLRGYQSVTHMLLDSQKVSIEMYENQLNIIFNELAPHMRKYAKLKQKQMNLTKMCFCDLTAPLPTDYNPPVTFSDLQDLVTEALGVLGAEYQEMVKRAFAERWIDYGDNVGKSTGASCTTPYGVHPFIKMTYTGTMRSAFTLAHELGHGGHFFYANKEQRLFDVRPSLYFVEAPSTMNELLLAQHLMKKGADPKMKQWVIIQLLGTYYHNFVTHLLEAEFQRRIYNLAEQEVALTANMLCNTKQTVLQEFWSDAVEISRADGMTWMRQPHYYRGLYPYTYSAGLTASTAIAQQINEEGQPAIDRWLKVLKAGGTLSPEELMKLAGIDMTNPEPIRTAVAYVGSLIDELERLYI